MRYKIEPTLLAFEGKVLTTGLPGKSPQHIFEVFKVMEK